MYSAQCCTSGAPVRSCGFKGIGFIADSVFRATSFTFDSRKENSQVRSGRWFCVPYVGARFQEHSSVSERILKEAEAASSCSLEIMIRDPAGLVSGFSSSDERKEGKQ